MNRPFTWIASGIFGIMAVGHAYRLIKHDPVVFGSHAIPQWASVAGFIVAAIMSWMLCREARGTTGA